MSDLFEALAQGMGWVATGVELVPDPPRPMDPKAARAERIVALAEAMANLMAESGDGTVAGAALMYLLRSQIIVWAAFDGLAPLEVLEDTFRTMRDMLAPA